MSKRFDDVFLKIISSRCWELELTDTSDLHAWTGQGSESRLGTRARGLCPVKRWWNQSDKQMDRHDAQAKMGHALVFVTCCPRWLSAWYAALWFQALCSAEQHPEQPTWQHMERTHLCLPSPSSLQSHGRWSPWHHKHKWELIQAQWNTYSVHVKNQGKWNMNLKVNASVTHFLVLEYTCCTCLAQHHRYQQHAASMMNSH